MSCWARGIVVLSLLLSLASLAFNALLIYKLYQVRQPTVGMLDEAITALDSLDNQTFTYEYHFQQNIPFEGDIPFEQEVMFPFKGTIPINTVVEVPVNTGLGSITIKVPINTQVYVDTSVPVKIDQTFHVKTEAPVDMSIPIRVQLDQSPTRDALQQVKEWLLELRRVM